MNAEAHFSKSNTKSKKHNVPSLQVRSLSKTFNENGPSAVDDLNFDIFPGESVAFLGPNGAGKSTTIKMLCGILSPTSGHSEISGFKSGSVHANRILGLVFGTRSQLYLHMTVAQCFDLVAEIYYVTGNEKQKRIKDLSDLFHIHDLLPRRVRTLSLGQRMRCELIAALVHKPEVLLADEPTIGLDIVAKNQLRQLIRSWQQTEKTTLLLTSHDLSDVEALCDRCILIDKGIKRFDGKLSELKGDLSKIRRIQVTTSKSEIKRLTGYESLKILSESEDFIHRYELSTDVIPMSEGLAIISKHYGDALQDISITEVNLEEVLGNLYGTYRS